jgi:hypothetical protein
MDKDTIRKMINAKFKYIIRCTYQKIQQQYFGIKDEKTEIMHVVVEKCSKYSKSMNRFSIFDQEFYCLKDVKEYIKELKNFNKFVKLQVIGL